MSTCTTAPRNAHRGTLHKDIHPCTGYTTPTQSTCTTAPHNTHRGTLYKHIQLCTGVHYTNTVNLHHRHTVTATLTLLHVVVAQAQTNIKEVQVESTVYPCSQSNFETIVGVFNPRLSLHRLPPRVVRAVHDIAHPNLRQRPPSKGGAAVQRGVSII